MSEHGALDAGGGHAARRAVLSPLLANLYLHPLDLLMEEEAVIGWCDTRMTS